MRYWSTPAWDGIERAQAFIELDLETMRAGTHLRLGLERRSDAQLIGQCTLYDIVQPSRRAQIGYSMNASAWGRAATGGPDLESIPMTDLSAFPITRKWPPQHPERLQLYSLPTPNGVKVSIALEEIGLPYEPHLVRFDNNDQWSPAFLSLNPNNKIPAILDPNGPGGKPLALFESGAILLYLAEKSGQLMPADAAARYETIQWLMFQMGGIGPMFGQVGFFHKFDGRHHEDKRPRDRYVAESKRLLAVLDQRLAGREWIMGDSYSVADIASFPWIRNLIEFYGAGELVGIADFAHVRRALQAFLARPAVIRGLAIPARHPPN